MCTAVWFVDKNGNFYMGRNLDWDCGYGQKVIVTPRHWSWDSRHVGVQRTDSAIIGMAVQVNGLPMYFECANEKGLMVEGLSFAAGFAHYAKPQSGKTNVASYELPLWLTSNFTTVDEVEKAAANLVITDDQSDPHFAPTPLHWIVADKNRAIVLEQDEKGLHLYHDGFGVLTNQPGFDFHRQNMRNYVALRSQWPGDRVMGTEKLTPLGVGPSIVGLPGDSSSISRFVRVAYLNASYPAQEGEKDNVTRLFHTLGSVSMVKGMTAMANGHYEYTLYTAGWSSATHTYYYSTYDDPAIRSVALNDQLATAKEPVSID